MPLVLFKEFAPQAQRNTVGLFRKRYFVPYCRHGFSEGPHSLKTRFSLSLSLSLPSLATRIRRRLSSATNSKAGSKLLPQCCWKFSSVFKRGPGLTYTGSVAVVQSAAVALLGHVRLGADANRAMCAHRLHEADDAEE